jgi:hypothetical protein
MGLWDNYHPDSYNRDHWYELGFEYSLQTDLMGEIMITFENSMNIIYICPTSYLL